MTRMETMTDAIARLTTEGFDDHFRVEEGKLVALEADRAFQPSELRIARELRFEGASNPSDEALLIALESESGDVRGTLCVAFGPEADEADARVLRALASSSSSSSS